MFLCCILSLIRFPSVEAGTWRVHQCCYCGMFLLTCVAPRRLWHSCERCQQCFGIGPSAAWITEKAPRRTNSEFGHIFGSKHVSTGCCQVTGDTPLIHFQYSLSYSGSRGAPATADRIPINFQLLGILSWHGTLAHLSMAWYNFTVFAEGRCWSLQFICISSKIPRRWCLILMCENNNMDHFNASALFWADLIYIVRQGRCTKSISMATTLYWTVFYDALPHRLIY